MRRFVIPVLIVVLALASAVAGQATSQFTVNELLKVRRVSDPQLSPDGRMIAYTITDVNMAANRSFTQIYLIPAAGGAEPRQLTNGASSASTPRWSPDGRRLAFVSGGQIQTIDIASGEIKKVTNLATGAGDPVWSPDGRMLAFVSEIYPECTTAECNRQRTQQAEESKVKAKVADRLLFRHWNTYKEGKRSHIFVVPADGGEARDLTPGDYDAPPFSLGGPTDYDFSPDSTKLVFARNTDKVEATSTNADLFVVPVAGGEAARITGSNLAADLSPVFSPDGRYIAYRAQARPGFESDRWQLMLYDRNTGKSRSITEKLDAYVESIAFTADGKKIYFTSGERGLQPVYSIPVDGGAISKVIADGFNDDVKISRDGRTIVFTRNSATQPTEIFRANADGSGVTQITHTNDAFISRFNLQPAESVSFEGAGGAKVAGWVVKPANFTASQKWPLIVLVHGGPQGAWNNNWGYRWNPQVFAAAGYVVFMPNPRGSTGYGQKFTDEISGDWGGKAYTDIMNGVAYIISQGYVDKERIGAAGGSYGGYMVNWLEGHNNDKRFRFKALVSHAGVFNLTSMYGATEELWFTDWEFKGTPWDNPEMYQRWSPHMFVRNFQTPMLVIHGELDYRVPYGEGLQLFTALQRRGVESKLVIFPDEGHWILKPQNSELWYKTVLNWFDSHLKTGA
ncbi:MAG TPA: S9 family peptidase [Pyrinomonadaceae bacterium]|jgi:dipeptidyl aminopeptidase/acylaminoacyl peptidase